MKQELNPKDYGLNSRVVLHKINGNTIIIVKERKSRIIMKDGLLILEQANKIKQKEPNISIKLKISSPICSKTRRFLMENGVEII